MVKWLPEKSKSKNTKKFTRVGTKNVRNSHMLRTLQILPLFEVFKLFWNLIWLGYCINMFIILRRWSNDLQKNPNLKILKNSLHFEGVKWIVKFKVEVYRKNMWGVWISILLVIIPFLYFQYFNQFFWKAKKSQLIISTQLI